MLGNRGASRGVGLAPDHRGELRSTHVKGMRAIVLLGFGQLEFQRRVPKAHMRYRILHVLQATVTGFSSSDAKFEMFMQHPRLV